MTLRLFPMNKFTVACNYYLIQPNRFPNTTFQLQYTWCSDRSLLIIKPRKNEFNLRYDNVRNELSFERKSLHDKDGVKINVSFDFKLTLSNISKIFALGWWMVQMMVCPFRANLCNKEMHCKHDALSRPLETKQTVQCLTECVNVIKKDVSSKILSSI